MRRRLVEPPVSTFASPGGRRFIIVGCSPEEDRGGFEAFRWEIYHEGKGAGLLFRDRIYRAPLEWHASTRMLHWAMAVYAPVGVGYDVAAFETAEECIDAWARSADQILDWAEGKEVWTPYGKVRRKL